MLSATLPSARGCTVTRDPDQTGVCNAIDRRSWFCGANSAQKLGFVLLFAVPSVAHGQRAGPAVHTEVRRIIDAFLGHWTLTGRSTETGVATPSLVTGTIDCESAAGGMAVYCRVVNAVIVEDFSIGFPSPGTMTITSIERAAEGRSTLDLVGTRELRVR